VVLRHSDVVDQLDLSAIHAVYEKEKRGQPPYDPRLNDEVVWYSGYCTGVFQFASGYKKAVAGRQSRSKCWRRANDAGLFGPSRTFARSTSKHWRKLFEQVLANGRWSADRSSWAAVSLDGTKLKANAKQAQGDERTGG